LWLGEFLIAEGGNRARDRGIDGARIVQSLLEEEAIKSWKVSAKGPGDWA